MLINSLSRDYVIRSLSIGIALVLISCTALATAPDDSPRQAADRYLSLWRAQDYGDMYFLHSSRSRRVTSITEFLSQMRLFRDVYIIRGYRITEVLRQGAATTVHYEMDVTPTTSGPFETLKYEMSLIKYKGKWLID